MYLSTLKLADKFEIRVDGNVLECTLDDVEKKLNNCLKIKNIKIFFLKKTTYWSTCQYLIYYAKTKDDDHTAYINALTYWEKSK